MSLTRKIVLDFSMVLLSVGKHLNHWPTIETLSPVRGKLLAELALKFSDVNHLFRFFDFRDFLEKHLYFFILYLMGISNIVKMLLYNIRLNFILS